MLAYHPAFDLYNCIFRVLCLLDASQENKLTFDKLRIWDFYLTFPGEIRDISFPTELLKLKNSLFKVPKNDYERLTDPKRIFEKMHSYQLCAVSCLASYGFIDTEQLKMKIIKRTEKEYPAEIAKEINSISELKKSIIRLLVMEFVQMPFYGQHGLKHRTRLIDYKYDPRI